MEQGAMVFTSKLLGQMESNQQIELALKRVVTEVKAASKGKQEPWMEGSIEGDFCFGGCGGNTGSAAQPASMASASSPARLKSHEEIEQEGWESARASNNPSAIQEYLKQYPKGRFAGQAKILIATLKIEPAVIAEPSPSVVSASSLKDSVTDMEFVQVTGGCFTTNGKQTCLDHFNIGKYEVTQGQYKRVMGSNPSRFSSCGDYCPVEQVSWNDAKTFISRLNNQTGRNYRLPTEAEWEYACRSGGRNEEYCGGNYVDAVAWYDNNSGKTTHQVGQKQPNGLGIYDMSGNVWEWVQDWYSEDYPSSGRNPTGVLSGSEKVLRGGSWTTKPVSVRASKRGWMNPANRNYGDGFRLVLPQE